MNCNRRTFLGSSLLAYASRSAWAQGSTDAARALWEDVMEILSTHYYEPVDEARLTLTVLRQLGKDLKVDPRLPNPPTVEVQAVRSVFAQEIARFAALPGQRTTIEEMFVKAIDILCDTGLKFSTFRSEKVAEAEQYVKSSAPADIGMTNYIDSGRVLCRPFEESPAWQLGIREGDELLSINGTSVRGQPLWKVGRDRHGIDGSRCDITVQQHREPHRIISGSIVRRVLVRTPTVSRIYGGIMVRIPSFGVDALTSPKPELLRGLQQLKPGDLLTLDLRGNAGGSTENAVEALGCLLPGPAPRPAPLLVAKRVIRGPLASKYPPEITTEEPCKSTARRITILVDGGTASVAELVVQVLVESPDLHVTVGGEPTFGKHLLQYPFALPRRPSVAISIPYGHMSTAKGTTWEGKIKPTFAAKG